MKFETKKWIILGSIAILMLLAQLLAVLPAPVLAATSTTCKAWHIVTKDDTLNNIAKFYNIYLTSLLKANSLVNPYTLYVQQKLCIPSKAAVFDAKAKVPTYATRLASDFSVSRKNDQLTISTKNFPKNNTFYVKVYDLSKPGTFTKIGLFKSGDKTNESRKFTLTNKLRKINTMQVCLKNSLTDANICRPVTK